MAKFLQKFSLLIVAIMTSAVSTFAYDIQYGNYYFNLLEQTDFEDVGNVKTYHYNVEATSKEGGYSKFYILYSGTITPPSTFTTTEQEGSQVITKIYTLTKIGAMAFANNPDATEIIIPETVTAIEDLGLTGNSKLQKITCLATVPPTHGTSFLLVTPDIASSATLYVPSGCKSAYSTANGWKEISNIQEITPSFGDHNYVDLGLPSAKLWSTCNLGATTPTGYGTYIAQNTIDQVKSAWGEYWTTPTKAEYQELIDYCTWTWGTQNGVSGYTIKGTNGNTMFLPAAGFKTMGYGQSVGSGINYWSKSPSTESGFYYMLFGTSSSVNINNAYNASAWTAPVRPICTQKATVKVESISLSETSLTMTEGDTKTLTATISPSNATNKEITWSSSNPSVATVSSTGMVTAVAEGNTVITAKANDNSNVSTSCMITVCEKSDKDYEIVTDINKYQKRIYPEVYNLADNSWYMLNSLNEYEKYGVVINVPNKHKWHTLTSTYSESTKQESEISHYLGFTALRISPSSATSGKIYFNNFTDTATIKETDEHYYINSGTASNLTLTRIFPGRNYYSNSTTYSTSNGLTLNNDGKYYYEFDQTMYLKGLTSASTKASCVEVYIPDLNDIPTYQGKIVVMNDSLYLYDNGYWKTKGKNQTGWIDLRNDLDHYTLASALRFDLSENIGYGCCWASFCNGDDNVLQFSPWDGVYVKSWDILQNRQYISSLPVVSGTSTTYELNFANVNLSPSYFNGGDFNYAFFTTQVYLDELPARYTEKSTPQEVKEDNYNNYLESGTTSYSMSQMGGNVTKCIGYYIKNKGTESITINKVIMRDATLLNEISSSTDGSLTGTLAAGETKSLEITIHQNIDLVYEWQYTYKGKSYTFKSWNYDVVKVSSIELSQTNLTIKKGETTTLSATVKPDDAKQKEVSWSSSDQNIVSIDSKGNLIGIGTGKATITATATDGSGVTATCQVTVEESDAPSTGDYNCYLQSGSDGSSLVQIGSYVTKSVSFHITNNGVESIYITKLTCKKASDKSTVVSTSTDASLLGTLDSGATKSLSITIYQDIDLVYEWEYIYKGNSYVFQSWENYSNAIHTISSTGNNDVVAIYDVSGKVIPQMQKGLNIIKMRDGSIKKVIKE